MGIKALTNKQKKKRLKDSKPLYIGQLDERPLVAEGSVALGMLHFLAPPPNHPLRKVEVSNLSAAESKIGVLSPRNS